MGNLCYSSERSPSLGNLIVWPSFTEFNALEASCKDQKKSLLTFCEFLLSKVKSLFANCEYDSFAKLEQIIYGVIYVPYLGSHVKLLCLQSICKTPKRRKIKISDITLVWRFSFFINFLFFKIFQVQVEGLEVC